MHPNYNLFYSAMDYHEKKLKELQVLTMDLIVSLGISPAALTALAESTTTDVRVSRKMAARLIAAGVGTTEKPEPTAPNQHLALPKDVNHKYVTYDTSAKEAMEKNGYQQTMQYPAGVGLSIYRRTN